MSAHPYGGFTDTPILPDSGYHVHDPARPQPPVVTPGRDGAPPSDAVVLFDGTSLDGWRSAKHPDQPAAWRLVDGAMEVVPKTGDIQTAGAYGDGQYHVEFRSPDVIKGQSQGRGNSGVFLLGLYEVQVLDNHENPTYADGTVGAVYGQFAPLVNAIRPPGDWNTYDLLWRGPVFADGQLVRPAVLTVLLNGVVVQHARVLHGPTRWRALAEYAPHPAALPLKLQDHGDLVRFRNVWYRPERVEPKAGA